MKKENFAGKLVVIDGADGSGKATQTKKLVEYFESEGVLVKTLDFPQYTNNFFGKFTGECLRGQYGDFVTMHPKIASVMYACDRFESSQTIKQWLADGCVVVLDRYVSSNQIHQGQKMKNIDEQKEFLQWLDDMEFGIFKLPRPDIILFLDVPFEVSKELLKDKVAKHDNKGKDTVESDDEYMQRGVEQARKLVAEMNNWLRVDCLDGAGKLASIDEIHQRVVQVLVRL